MTYSATEEALIERIQRIVGYVPVGTRDLLHILSHPDIISYSERYLGARRHD